MPPVTLQINLAPPDLRHASVLLPHQLQVWQDQVDEVLLVLDLRKGAGRFSHNWEQNKPGLLELAHAQHGCRVLELDHSTRMMKAVSETFLRGATMPLKDHRGGPYYAYFFGLHAARNDFILHSDSDMLFGGGSRTWIDSALRVHAENPQVLVSSPHPGPPAPDGKLRHLLGEKTRLSGFEGWLLPEMSTRLFLLSRKFFTEKVGGLCPRRPGLRSRFTALIDGNPAQALPEELFSTAMAARGLRRFDFLGTEPGCWSLHPPYRSEDFYRRLPDLLHTLTNGTLPAGQLGDHDINESLVDWSEAHTRMARSRWWHRLLRRIKFLNT